MTMVYLLMYDWMVKTKPSIYCEETKLDENWRVRGSGRMMLSIVWVSRYRHGEFTVLFHSPVRTP